MTVEIAVRTFCCAEGPMDINPKPTIFPVLSQNKLWLVF